MSSITAKKVMINAPEPDKSKKEKLAQIRSGGKLKRTKSGLQRKSVVMMGKDGSKIIKNQTEEQFEESAVTRKKRNYVMYESKLTTEKNTQITELKKKKKPVRQPSPRIEEKIIMKKKKKEYIDNYQYHESKVLKNENPKYDNLVKHQRLGSIVGGQDETTYLQSQIYSTGTYIPNVRKIEEPKYSTKTTIIKTPYKPIHTPTPYVKPTYTTMSYNKPDQTLYQTIHNPLPYKPVIDVQNVITKTSLKTPYPRLRENRTQLINITNTSREGAKTPGIKTSSLVDVNRTITNYPDYSIKTFNVKKPNNIYTKKSEIVTNQIMPRRGKTPTTYNTRSTTRTEEKTITNNYRTRNPASLNLYQSNLNTNENRSTITKINLTKAPTFLEDEPQRRFEDNSYGTNTIAAISRVSRRRIEDDNDGINESRRNNVSRRLNDFDDGRRSEKAFEVRIERRTEVYDDSAEYGKGPSIRNKYKHKK